MRTLLLLALLPLAACGGSPCQKTVDKMVSCKQMSDKDADKAVERCETDSKDPAKAESSAKANACAEQEECGAFMSCMGAVSVDNDIAKATKEGTWGMAGYQCKDPEGDALKAACGRLFDVALPAMAAEITKMRDTGAESPDSCTDYTLLAEKKGADAKAAADTLCAEVDAAKYARDCEAAAKTNADANKADYPFDCNMARDSLAKLTTDWAKTRSESMAKNVALGLGKVIFKAKVPDMKYVCETGVEPIYKDIKQYNITDPELDPLVAKAAPLCEPKP
jgi:hypothetical protein